MKYLPFYVTWYLLYEFYIKAAILSLCIPQKIPNIKMAPNIFPECVCMQERGPQTETP